MKIEMTRVAQRDLREIDEYIATTNENAALTIASQIHGRVSTLMMFPLIGSELTDYRKKDKLREILVNPYRVIDSIEDEEMIKILRIIHSARQLPNDLV